MRAAVAVVVYLLHVAAGGGGGIGGVVEVIFLSLSQGRGCISGMYGEAH